MPRASRDSDGGVQRDRRSRQARHACRRQDLRVQKATRWRRATRRKGQIVSGTCTCRTRRNLDCPEHGDGGTEMAGVREYAEGMPVRLVCRAPLAEAAPRAVIAALNEAGCNGVDIDVLDLIEWLRANRPELLEPQIV